MNRRLCLLVLASVVCLLTPPVLSDGSARLRLTDTMEAGDLESHGIHFTVPADWPRGLRGLNYDSADHATVSFIWRNPSNEGINVTIVTFKGGFTLLNGATANAAQKLDEEYALILSDSRSNRPPAHYIDLKKQNLGSVPGFFFTTQFDGLEEIGQPSEEIYWKGYRTYLGKTQEVTIELDSTVKRLRVLQTIFDTASIEQDRPTTEH